MSTKGVPGEGTAEVHAPAAAAFDARLAERLFHLLYRSAAAVDLARAVAELEEEFGERVYAELLYLLSHLRFEPPEARRHWHAILAHRAGLETKLGEPVDLRVALVSYFVQVNRKLQNPKVIELKVFEETHASAYRDELTGLLNYRAFMEALTRELARAEREGRPLSLLMCDIDDFKLYNDRLGHEAGNEALAIIARLLASAVRGSDMAARYGGEEFALILPSTGKAGALEVAERARKSVASYRFPGGRDQPGSRLTVSIGAAAYPVDARDAKELLRRADLALYLAKTSGKNRVQLAGGCRRAHPRVVVELRGSYRTLGRQARRLRTLDVSEGGMRFRCARPPQKGALLEVVLQPAEAAAPLQLTGRVVDVRAGRKRGSEVGVRWIEVGPGERLRLARLLRQAGPQGADPVAQ